MNRDFSEDAQWVGTDGRGVRFRPNNLPRSLFSSAQAGAARYQFFTSNRRTADQGPEPPPLLARTRQHSGCGGASAPITAGGWGPGRRVARFEEKNEKGRRPLVLGW